MSRAYRIAVRESSTHVVRAGDHVECQLGMLEILPPERMAGLLAQELARRGFQQKGEQWVRQSGDVTIAVDPRKGSVTVRTEGQEEVTVEGERVAWTEQDASEARKKQAADHARQELQRQLQSKADRKRDELQKKITDRLEGHLADVRRELDQAVNRVTAEALKEKAAAMGRIKEMTEDAQTGSLTIVVEV
jgi:hypothetical protein